MKSRKTGKKRPAYSAQTWKTPLSGFERIWFQGVIGIKKTQFFLGTEKGTYCLSIPARAPFRIVDESYLQNFHKQFLRKGETQRYTPTWKVWGTTMVQELAASHFFSGVPRTKQFSYFVGTEDECIEFVCGKPKIEFIGPQGFSEVAFARLKKELDL